MSSPIGVVHAVRWRELCPWLLLVRAVRVALMVRVIVLAMLGVGAVQLGWRAIDAVVLAEDAPASFVELASPAPPLLTIPVPDDASDGPRDAGQLYQPLAHERWVGPIVRPWAWTVQPLTRLVAATDVRQTLGWLLAGTWALAVWALFGGAIARIAALYLARGETIGPLAALRAAATRWTATAGAPAFSFGLIVAAGVPLAIGGLLMRFDWLAAAGAALWPVALLFGAAAAGLSLLHLLGFPFMWATVAVERTDAFDALSRSWAYVYSRPLHLAFFVAFASLLGVLTETVVLVLLHGLVAGAHFGVAWGTGWDRLVEITQATSTSTGQENTALVIAAHLIEFWDNILLAAGTAFAAGYFWVVGTAIYLIMRRLVDATEIDEVAFDAGAPEPGLPPAAIDFNTDATPAAGGSPPSAAKRAESSAEPPADPQ